jgi:HlyD family secretion protein
MKPYLMQTICLGITALLSSCDSQAAIKNNPTVVTPAKPNAVVALGRIQPDGEVIKLSVTNAQDSRIDQMLVKEGDRVQKTKSLLYYRASSASKLIYEMP